VKVLPAQIAKAGNINKVYLPQTHSILEPPNNNKPNIISTAIDDSKFKSHP
jgi:hypothetical protein